MKIFLITYFSLTAGLSAQTGRMTGMVTDSAGATVQGAVVTANLQPPSPLSRTFQPFSMNALSDASGHFSLDELKPGVYTLCVEKTGSEVLNPCIWSDAATTSVVSPGATTSGVVVRALRGVTITVHLVDTNGILAANPKADDVLIGAGHNHLPFATAVVVSNGVSGKTLRLVVPAGQPINLSVFSSSLSLGDQSAAPLPSKMISVPLTAAQTAMTAKHQVTLHVLGLAKGSH